MLGIITWKYSVFVLYARLIFTCGQWNRWCERRICHAWLSRARLFLSTFWQDFICISCCICWVLNRGIGYCCGAGSHWALLLPIRPTPKAFLYIILRASLSNAYSMKMFVVHSLINSINTDSCNQQGLRLQKYYFYYQLFCHIFFTLLFLMS